AWAVTLVEHRGAGVGAIRDGLASGRANQRAVFTVARIVMDVTTQAVREDGHSAIGQGRGSDHVGRRTGRDGDGVSHEATVYGEGRVQVYPTLRGRLERRATCRV